MYVASSSENLILLDSAAFKSEERRNILAALVALISNLASGAVLPMPTLPLSLSIKK